MTEAEILRLIDRLSAAKQAVQIMNTILEHPDSAEAGSHVVQLLTMSRDQAQQEVLELEAKIIAGVPTMEIGA